MTAGFAEIAAGAISIGLGGYLAARTDREHYEAERQREEFETLQMPGAEREEVAQILREYGLTDVELLPVVNILSNNRKKWVDFMMRFELGLEAPDPNRAKRSALTIALAYIAGGFVPLSPYIIGRKLSIFRICQVDFTPKTLKLQGESVSKPQNIKHYSRN